MWRPVYILIGVAFGVDDTTVPQTLYVGLCINPKEKRGILSQGPLAWYELDTMTLG